MLGLRRNTAIQGSESAPPPPSCSEVGDQILEAAVRYARTNGLQQGERFYVIIPNWSMWGMDLPRYMSERAEVLGLRTDGTHRELAFFSVL